MRRQGEDKIGNWQHGFRPGRSTADLVFALKTLLEKGWEWNKNKYIAFIDLEKAFDRINRERLSKIMGDEYYGIHPKLVRIVKSKYTECRNKVKR